MENEVGDGELRMDLDLNLGPPSPSRLDLDLGLGSTQLLFGGLRSRSERDGVWSFQDPDLSTVIPSSVENGEFVNAGQRLQEPSPQTEPRIARSSQARYRWRRRFSRIPSEFFDPAASNAAHGLQRNSSMGHLLIFSPVDDLGLRSEEAINPLGTDTILGSISQERAVETCETCKRNAKDLIAKALADEGDEDKNSGSDFECNICLDMAKEPILTSCGHLFCWPCLYQWLHVHSDTKLCPVCKGEVTEMNVTPIYGRGSNASELEKKAVDSKVELDLKVPPRPHAHRIESLRHRIQRYSSRHVAEALRLSRRGAIIGEHSGVRADVSEERSHPQDLGSAGDMLDGIDAATDQILARLRVAQRLQQRESWEQRLHLRRRGLFRNAVDFRTDPIASGVAIDGLHGRRQSTVSGEGSDGWRLLSFPRLQRSDRLVSFSAGLSTVEGMLERFARTTDGTTYRGPSVPASINSTQTPPNQGAQQLPGHVPNEDRPSVSSTTVVMPSERRILDNVMELDSVGSSSPFRRRSNDASGSLDVDHAVSRVPKRRRLN